MTGKHVARAEAAEDNADHESTHERCEFPVIVEQRRNAPHHLRRTLQNHFLHDSRFEFSGTLEDRICCHPTSCEAFFGSF